MADEVTTSVGDHTCLLLIPDRRTVMGGNRGCGRWTWGAMLVVRWRVVMRVGRVLEEVDG